MVTHPCLRLNNHVLGRKGYQLEGDAAIPEKDGGLDRTCLPVSPRDASIIRARLERAHRKVG